MNRLSHNAQRALTAWAYFAVAAAFTWHIQPTVSVFGEEPEATSPTVWPTSAGELLKQGLTKTDSESIRLWKECHHEMIAKGEDVTRADLALALIFARAGRFDDTRQTLMTTAKRSPDSAHILRLLSWARLSDRQFTEGLEDVSSLVAVSAESHARTKSNDMQDAVTYAGEAFGFAEIAIKEVQPTRQGRFEELRKKLDEVLPEDSKASFAYAADGMRSKVLQAIEATRGVQNENREQDKAAKESRKQELESQQQNMQAEAAHRQQQAAEIERNARAILSQIQQQAAPLFAQLAQLESELSSLQNAQSREKEGIDKQQFDPAIASVKGQISGVQSNLQPLITQYNQVEQTAMGQLTALGMRVRQLGRIHGANNHRLKANNSKKADGVNATVSSELRKWTRLATYMPLDFELETRRVLGTTRRSGLTLE